MLLYIMLHKMFAYLMLLAALSNAVCLNNAFFSLPLIFASVFFHASLVYLYLKLNITSQLNTWEKNKVLLFVKYTGHSLEQEIALALILKSHGPSATQIIK